MKRLDYMENMSFVFPSTRIPLQDIWRSLTLREGETSEFSERLKHMTRQLEILGEVGIPFSCSPNFLEELAHEDIGEDETRLVETVLRMVKTPRSLQSITTTRRWPPKVCHGHRLLELLGT